MKHRDSKEKQSKAISYRINHSRRLDSLSYYRPDEKIQERFYRPAYGKIGERGKCYGERKEV